MHNKYIIFQRFLAENSTYSRVSETPQNVAIRLTHTTTPYFLNNPPASGLAVTCMIRTICVLNSMAGRVCIVKCFDFSKIFANLLGYFQIFQFCESGSSISLSTRVFDKPRPQSQIFLVTCVIDTHIK